MAFARGFLYFYACKFLTVTYLALPSFCFPTGSRLSPTGLSFPINGADGPRNAQDDLRELSDQLLPEPAETDGVYTYWREGCRRITADANLVETAQEGYEATLFSVALLSEGGAGLKHNLCWILGVDLDGKSLSEGPIPKEELFDLAQVLFTKL